MTTLKSLQYREVEDIRERLQPFTKWQGELMVTNHHAHGYLLEAYNALQQALRNMEPAHPPTGAAKE